MNSPHYYGNHIAHVSFCKIPGYSVLINNPRDTRDTWSILQAIREISEITLIIFYQQLHEIKQKITRDTWSIPQGNRKISELTLILKLQRITRICAYFLWSTDLTDSTVRSCRPQGIRLIRGCHMRIKDQQTTPIKARCLLTVICCPLIVICCLLSVVHRLLSVVRCPVSPPRCPLTVTPSTAFSKNNAKV